MSRSKPYRRAAEDFLKDNREDFWVANALEALRCLMAGAGRVHRIVDVNYMRSPRNKARASLARLREAEIAPERLLTTYLAVAGAIKEDDVRPGGEPGEYLRVQAAKAVFRLRSGYHSIYGPGPRQRYDRYPRSGGIALRHLGTMLEEACEHVAGAYLQGRSSTQS